MKLAHAVWHELPSSDKQTIEKMAYSLPSPSNYGRPSFKHKNYQRSSGHKSGNEWFAEMISLIVDDDKNILTWFRKNFINWKWRYKKSDIDTLQNMMKKPSNIGTGD